MNCPRCKTHLTPTKLAERNITIEVDACSSCGGTWFDKEELSRVENVVEPVFLEIRNIPGKMDQHTSLYCPSCSHAPLLGKAEHPRDNKVIIDYCHECKGIWLDKGELEAIQKENWLTSLGRIFNWLAGN